jgi:hypothetical protein
MGRERKARGKFFAALIGFAILAARCFAYDNNDFQVWQIENQEFKIGENKKIALEQEFRWGDNASDFYYQHYDAGFVYGLNKNIGLGAGYRHVLDKKKGRFKLENEPYLLCQLKYLFGGFQFDSRNRLEYRHFDYQTDFFRYRNKMALKFPWKFTRLKIQPYLSDEVFFSFLGAAFNENRFYSGLEVALAKNITFDAFYLLRHTRVNGSWPRANVSGTKIKVVF